MKLYIRLSLLLATSLYLSMSTIAQNTQAVWMYGFQNWMTAPNFGNRIAAVSAMSYNKIFLGVASNLLNVTGSYRDHIIAFVAQAQAADIEVEALTLQDPHFSFEDKHNNALIRVGDILQYNISNPTTAFTGIHIDPEPHILTEANHLGHDHLFWTTIAENNTINAAGDLDALAVSNPTLANTIKMRRDTIMSEYVDLLDKIRTLHIDPYNAAYDPNVIFSSTVGWWYNERRTGEPGGYLPSGATALSQHLDYIVPMVYSGGVGETSTDIVSRVTDEIQTAMAPTLVGISSESLANFPGGVPAAINEVSAAFAGNGAYHGVATFEYDHLISTAAFCPTVIVYDSIYSWVNANIIRAGQNSTAQQKTLPRENLNGDTDDYEDPTAQQMDDWADMLEDLMNGNLSSACPVATALGYEVINFQETSSGKKYYLLRTIPYDAATNPDPNFWGTYIIDQKPRLSNVVIQAPHPIKDANTGSQGLEIFRVTNAWFYMMAGTSRCNLICNTLAGQPSGVNCTSCSGSTSVCHSGSTQYLYPISDMAHNDSSIFQKTTEVLQAYRNPYFIQLHGFAKGTNDPFAVISNGTTQAPASGVFDPAPLLATELKNHCGLGAGEDICVVHIDQPVNGSKCDELKGTNSTQGRLLNNDPTPCENTESLTPSARFIHLEQAKDKFRDTVTDYRNVGLAILNAFNPYAFDVNKITDTTGLNISHAEPSPYSYNFIAPLRSELLCKNNHLGLTAVTNLIDITPSNTYEDETGTLTANGTIGSTDRVWLIAEESIVLTEGFEAKSDDFFSAELKKELDFCETPDSYMPNSFGYRFFTSLFGPRMTSNSGIIDRPYDFHRGEDIVDKAFPTAIKPDIICVCDGIVHEIFDENDLPPGSNIELAPDEGRSVTVKCDSTFKGNNFGNIYTAYRHLSFIEPGLTEGAIIRKGDLIGRMGSSGSPSPTGGHLHFSVQRDKNGQLINVHPMRLFNNAINRHLNLPIDDEPTGTPSEQQKKRVNLTLLDYQNGSTNLDDNWAMLRVAVPYNKTSLRAVIVRHGTSYNHRADFEKISEERDGNASWLDDPIVGKLKLFPLPFVRAGSASFSAHGRYESIKADLPGKVTDHPAIIHPVDQAGIYTTPAYVLDIRAKGLPLSFDPYQLKVDVIDLWGNGVRGTFSPPTPNALVSTPGTGFESAAAQSFKTAKESSFAMRVYPNPTADNEVYVAINVDDQEEWSLVITNISGQILLQSPMVSQGSTRYTLDVHALKPGIYFVQAQTGGRVLTEKLVRQ